MSEHGTTPAPQDESFQDSLAPEQDNKAETFEYIEELATPEGAHNYIEGLKRELDDPQMQSIGRLLGGSEKVQQAAIQHTIDMRHEDGKRAQRVADQITENAKKMYGAQNVNRYKEITSALRSVEQLSKEHAYIGGETGTHLLTGLIAEAANKDVEDVYTPHSFVHGTLLNAARYSSRPSVDLSTCYVDKAADSIDIPIGMFVSAQGMSDWDGSGGGYPKKVQSLVETPASEIPSINDITGYILPDGRLYFMSNNAHRVAAAVKKGQTSVTFAGWANIHVLDRVPPGLDVARSQAA